jgi:hypothetical protein
MECVASTYETSKDMLQKALACTMPAHIHLPCKQLQVRPSADVAAPAAAPWLQHEESECTTILVLPPAPSLTFADHQLLPVLLHSRSLLLQARFSLLPRRV